jgi:hypothetical protein
MPEHYYRVQCLVQRFRQQGGEFLPAALLDRMADERLQLVYLLLLDFEALLLLFHGFDADEEKLSLLPVQKDCRTLAKERPAVWWF